MSTSSWRTRAFAAALGLAAGMAFGQLSAPPALAGDWGWPVHGRVVTAYSNDNARPYAAGMHRGIDIAAPAGAEVVAARTGEVTYAGALGYAGLVVAVRTADDRYVTSYLHLGGVAVRRGERVAGGDRLGTVGTTGRRSVAEPHLHFGVRLAGGESQYVNPLELLPALAGASPGAAPAPVQAPVPARPQPAPVPVRAGSPAGVPQPVRAPARGRVQPLPARMPVPAGRLVPARGPRTQFAHGRAGDASAELRPAPAGRSPRAVPVGPRSKALPETGHAGTSSSPLPPARVEPGWDWGRVVLVVAVLGLAALAWAQQLRRRASAVARRGAAAASALRSAPARLPVAGRRAARARRSRSASRTRSAISSLAR